MHTISESELEHLTSRVASQLLLLRQRLAVAESCTGGWLAKCCTDLAGSSSWFERGYVTYSNQAKHDVLGVDEQLICTYGAVSKQTARAMAEGTLKQAKADISVAITGIAGPSGGSADKPVGTVWIAWATAKNVLEVNCYHFTGDRKQVRIQAVQCALEGIIKNARA